MTAELSYLLDGGQPAVSLSVTLAADGTARVDVLTEASLPQQPPLRFGSFDAEIDTALADRVRAWAATASFVDGGAGNPSMGTMRLLAVGSAAPRVVDPGCVDAELESALGRMCLAALAHPVGAVEVSVQDAALRIAGLGPKPFAALLVASDAEQFWARVWRDDAANPNGRRYLDRAELDDAPHDVLALRVGDTVTLPLPPADDQHDGDQRGGFIFWRAGPAQVRAIVAGSWSA